MGNEKLDPLAVGARLRIDAMARASADPLPGPSADAYDDDPVLIHGMNVRRFKASDWGILKKLDSPIYRQFLEVQKPIELREEVPFTNEEGYEMICQFTHSPAENRAALAKGREYYLEWALQEVSDKLEPWQTVEVIDAVQKQFVASIATAQRHGSGDDSDLEKKSAKILS